MISNIDHAGGGMGQDPAPQLSPPTSKPLTSDTANHFLVGAQGNTLMILNPPKRPLTVQEALNLAGWLLVLAEVVDPEKAALFPCLVDHIKKT